MDPIAAYEELANLIGQAQDTAENLFLWFHRGGFAPDGMTKDRRELRRQFHSIWNDLDQLSGKLARMREDAK